MSYGEHENKDRVVRLSARESKVRPSFGAVTLAPHVIGSTHTAVPRNISSSRHMVRPCPTGGDRPSDRVVYVSGFARFFSRVAVLLIVPVLIFRPILPLYAADESVAPASVEAAPAPEASVSADAPPQPTASATEDVPTAEATPPAASTAPDEAPQSSDPAPVSEEAAVTPDATETPPEQSPTTSSSTDEVLAVIPDAATSSDATSTADTSAVPVGTVSETPMASDTPPVADDATSTVTEAPPTVVTEEPTTTVDEVTAPEVSQPETPVAPELTKDEIIARELESRSITMREELKKEIEADVLKGCLTLDGVGYYCLKDDARIVASGTPSETVTAVHADVVVGGTNKQIIAERGTEMIQVTHNEAENAFPAKDVGGTHLVWQTQDGGRWQIYYADMSSSTPVIEQLTHGTESNFNPRVDNNSVVWQGWVDGNWEIFLADKLAPSSYYPADNMPQLNTMLGIDATWHVVRITNNSVHDMFPAIAGGLVTWQSFEDGVWSVYAYSVTSGKTTKLSADGTKSENPRFAVTWDERDANGNTRMMGYDLATGGKVDMTNAARTVADNSKPYVPQAPRPTPEPLALPGTATSTATSTSMRGSGGGDGDGTGTSTDTTI